MGSDLYVLTERAKKRGSFDETEWLRRLNDDEIKFSESERTSLQAMCKRPIITVMNN